MSGRAGTVKSVRASDRPSSRLFFDLVKVALRRLVVGGYLPHQSCDLLIDSFDLDPLSKEQECWPHHLFARVTLGSDLIQTVNAHPDLTLGTVQAALPVFRFDPLQPLSEDIVTPVRAALAGLLDHGGGGN